MKSLLFALCFGALILVGCEDADIVGSGTITSQDRPASAIHGLDVESSVDVVVTHGSTYSVRVEADDNIIDRITTNIVNGVLNVEVSRGTGISFSRATVYVTTNELNTLLSHGSGDVTVGEGFDVENMTVYLYGSGDVHLQNIRSVKLTTNLLGSGNLTMNGEIDNHSGTLKGSGNLNAYDVVTKESAIVIYGSGNAQVHAMHTLYADIFGSGSIYYKGDPDVIEHVSGSGKVRRWL